MAKSNFAGINTVLPDVAVKLGLDRRMQEQALFALWPSILEPIYASRSAPLYIDDKGFLVVAAENGSAAQELSFLKAKLLAKLQPVALGLGLTVKGMRFDLKRFSRLPISESSPEVSKAASHSELIPSNTELAALTLGEAEKQEIANLKEKLQDNLSSQLTERVVCLVEKKLRLKKWYVMNKMPFCTQCQERLPQSRRQLDTMLCLYCSGK